MRCVFGLISLCLAGAACASASVTSISDCPGVAVTNGYATPTANFGTTIGVCGTVNATGDQMSTPPGATETQLESFLGLASGTFSNDIGSAIKFNFNAGPDGGTVNLSYSTDTICDGNCNFYVLGGNVTFLAPTFGKTFTSWITVPSNYSDLLGFGVVSFTMADPTLNISRLTYEANATGVPEPASCLLLVAGLGGFALVRKGRRSTSAA